MDGGVYCGKDRQTKVRQSRKNLIGLKLTEEEAAKLRNMRPNMT